MKYKLTNCSRPYTFMTKDKEVAALVLCVFNNIFGAETKEHKESIPDFLYASHGQAEEWYLNTFARTPEEGFSKKRDAVKDALDTLKAERPMCQQYRELDLETYARYFAKQINASQS